ncbi:MAG: exopolysaccharide production protein ExoQ [Frankiales bacterium]|jgi:O-antigen ligase|nr:exopolysaccharide production protein ExoQ [Frankiales bacterium]
MTHSLTHGWWSMVMLLAIAATVATWAVVVGPALVSAAQRGRMQPSIMLLYVVGCGQAVLVLVDPAFERGATTAGSTLHDTISRGTNAVSLLLVLLSLLSRAQGSGRKPTSTAVGLTLYGLVIPLSGLVNGGFNSRSLTFPLVVLAVGLVDNVPIHVVLSHIRVILRLLTAGSLVWLLLSYGHATLLLQGRTLLGIDQLAGLTRHPNSLGPLAAFALALEIVASRRVGRLFFGATAVTTCVLAQSRAGWLAAAVVVLVLSGRRLGPRVTVPATLLLAFVGASIAASPQSLDVVTRLNGRGEIWSVAWSVARSHPMLGAGPNALLRQAELGHVSAVGIQAHNQFLDTLAKTGLIGLAAVLLFVSAAVACGISLIRQGQPIPLALTMALLIDCMFEAPLELKLLPLACVAVIAAAQKPVQSSALPIVPNHRQGRAPGPRLAPGHARPVSPGRPAWPDGNQRIASESLTKSHASAADDIRGVPLFK